MQTQSNQVQSIPYTSSEPRQHQKSQHHTTTYQHPRFPHKHNTIQCNHNNPSIINKENLVPEITTTTDTTTVDSVPTTIIQNRKDFQRNRNNNQTNQTSNTPIHNSSNHINTKQNPNNAPIVCYKCNTVGHFSNNCQNPSNRNQPWIYSNQTNTQTQQQQSTQQLNHQANNNQTQQQLNSEKHQLTQ